MSDWQTELTWTTIAYALLAGLTLVALVGLFLGVPALRRRWLPMARLRPGPWAGHEVFLAFCVLMGFPNLVVTILVVIGFFNPLIGPLPDLDPPGPDARLYALRCQIIASPLTLVATLGMLFTILFARCRCRPHHLGLSWARWPANVALGLGAFLVATPIILGVNVLAHLIASQILPTRAHPFTLVSQGTLEFWEWIVLGFMATVAAPLLEEIVFRGVLLGWLRRASLNGHLAIISATILLAVTGVFYDVPETDESVVNLGPPIFAVILAGGYIWQMVRLRRRFALDETEVQDWLPQPGLPPLEANSEWSRVEARRHDEQRLAEWREANANLAIYGSAMLFAFFHVDHWPAPFGLFLFALVAGYLARRTQSLVGPITFHAVFNLVAFMALYGGTLYGAGKNGKAETTAPVAPSGVSASSVPASQLPLRR